MSHLNLVAEADNGVVRIGSKYCSEVLFLGSSIDCGATPGTSAASFYFYPKFGEGKKGLIAMARHVDAVGKNSSSYWESVFFEMRNEGGKYIVDLDKNALLGPNRVGQCSSQEGVEAVIKGLRFSSHHNPGAGIYRVDGNTICGYLAGTLSAADVIHAAAEPKREENYKRLYHEAMGSLSAERAKRVETERQLSFAMKQARLDHENSRQIIEALNNKKSWWSGWFGHQPVRHCGH